MSHLGSLVLYDHKVHFLSYKNACAGAHTFLLSIQGGAKSKKREFTHAGYSTIVGMGVICTKRSSEMNIRMPFQTKTAFDKLSKGYGRAAGLIPGNADWYEERIVNL